MSKGPLAEDEHSRKEINYAYIPTYMHVYMRAYTIVHIYQGHSIHTPSQELNFEAIGCNLSLLIASLALFLTPCSLSCAQRWYLYRLAAVVTGLIEAPAS